MKNSTFRGREGFTLIEVLVTLILLAVLAAAVFPVVTQQADKAEPSRFAGDLASIRSGIEAFRLDVRPYYPQDLEDLVYPISAQSDVPLLPATQYGISDSKIGNWDGPYIDSGLDQVVASSPTVSTDVIETAFEGTIQPALVCAAAVGTATTACGANQFVALEVEGIDADEAAELETAIDGTSGALTTGKFRHAGGTTALYIVGPFF